MATTVRLAFIVTVHTVPDVESHPVQLEKLLPPEVDGAVRLTEVPSLYVRVNGVVPLPALLMSVGLTAICAPLAGFVEFTVSTRVTTCTGLTVRLAVTVPFKVAVTEAVTTLAVIVVFAVKVALVLLVLVNTVTLEGTTTWVSLLCRATVQPGVGVEPLRVTVPVELLPPCTGLGLKLRLATLGHGQPPGGQMVRMACTVPFSVAVMGALTWPPGTWVLAVN